MLLKKMNLENFRQFIGTQSIDFSTEPDRNVTIILGENGSGKTSGGLLSGMERENRKASAGRYRIFIQEWLRYHCIRYGGRKTGEKRLRWLQGL